VSFVADDWATIGAERIVESESNEARSRVLIEMDFLVN